MEWIIKSLIECNSFYEFLKLIKETDGLTLATDNGWSWVEYYGKIVPGSEKERFTKQKEIDDLLRLAGVTKL